MLLVGMFDSPYVRRVAISMRALGIPFDHANWSVGADQARIAELNPLGQVPVVVLDGGEVLIDSATIVDHLDQCVEPERRLVPATGEPRRRVLHLCALAAGLADKARLQAYEYVFRPAHLRHEPVRLRLRAQMLAAATALEGVCAARGAAEWLAGDRMTQADITLACAFTYATEAVGLTSEEAALPALRARCARLADVPAIRNTYVRFEAPVVT